MEVYLLLLPECKKTHTRYLHDFESHARNVTLGFATTTETGNQDFVVLVDEVQATVVLDRGQLDASKSIENYKPTGTKAVTFFPFLTN